MSSSKASVMRKIFYTIIFLHAVMHLITFYMINGTEEGLLPAWATLLWVGAVVLFLVFAVMHFREQKYAWVVGLVAAAISQIVLVQEWEASRFGTVPNLVVLFVCFGLGDSRELQKRFRKEIVSLLNHSRYLDERIVTEQDISTVPEPVQKWLRRSGVIGRPFISVGRMTQDLDVKLKPDMEHWIPATAVQYSSVVSPSFVWVVRAKVKTVVNFLMRDKYQDGKGEMLVKYLEFFPDFSGDSAKVDQAALQRYLGEMVWFPSLALAPCVAWEQIDENTAKATMNYEGVEGSGVFHFSGYGDVLSYEAIQFMIRYDQFKRRRWVMDVLEYKHFDGILVPSRVTSTWQRREGDWTWLKLRVTSLCYNESAVAKFSDEKASL